MIVELAGKKALVISDDERLSQAIELILARARMVVTSMWLCSPRGERVQPETDDFDVAIVATGSLACEPIIGLAMDSLSEYIGKVPLLLICERTSSADPDRKIYHLTFPFNIDNLLDRVREILR
jgi:hypothetical protein